MNNLPKYVIFKGDLPSEIYKIKFASNNWKWKSGGNNHSISWDSFDNRTKEILKLYLIYRQRELSIESISKSEVGFINALKKQKMSIPFMPKEVFYFCIHCKYVCHIYSLRKLFEFGFLKFENLFLKYAYDEIKEYNIPKRKPYDKIFLNQEVVDSKGIEEVKRITKSVDENELDFEILRDNIILQFCLELAPRPYQFYLLNKSDFEVIKGSSKDYYSLSLPMSKKIKSNNIEKRNRSISTNLGRKVLKLLLFKNYKKNSNNALFIDKKGKRLTSSNFTKIVKKETLKKGIILKPTDFRHSLGQALADQGASADIIAELLGHNSTVPARAYISSTPKIADIKAKALAKNITYQKLNEMLTGNFVEDKDIEGEKRIKGIIGNQYIGGIGMCGLPNDTSCKKNPVYSCYTCIKFHPFRNKKQHIVVKEELQKQAQYFIDISEKGNDIEYNRPITQLNETIRAVDDILNILKEKNEY
ncbi:Site-specific integrase [Tenacibaculum sp. 190130A14a]|uniref:Site-specific integrase n=1 Tax=Tenacibaculum polynesiense TaxID=3137857 RepID=A0ABM9PC04_9FLAO